MSFLGVLIIASIIEGGIRSEPMKFKKLYSRP